MSQSTAAQERPKWGVQASLIQPREPAFWLFVVLLAIGGYFFVQEESLFSKLSTGLGLSWALVLVYALPVAFIVYRLDLFEKEPKMLLAAAVVWGGVIAVSLAGQVNGHWLSVIAKMDPSLAREWGPAIVGPGVEETLKLMGVVTIFLIARNEFDGVLDGFVYGAMVGLGFTVVEDVGYFMGAVFSSISDVSSINQTQPVIDMALIRIGGGGLYGHVLFTGLTGMGFAYFATQTRAAMSKRVAFLVLGVGAGVAAHCIWNSPLLQSVLDNGGQNPSTIQWIEYGAIKGGPFLILLGLLVVLATRSEERMFLAIVAGEPAGDVILDAEAKSLGSVLSRRAARNAAGREKGPLGKRLMGQLQQAQVNYALARSKADSLDDPAVESQRLAIRSLRSQLASLPNVVATAPVAAAGPVASAASTVAATPVAQSAAPAASVAQPVAVAQPAPVAQPGAVAQPAPVAQPAVAPVAPAWAPTHLVPPGGMQAWPAPDPSQPAVVLGERLELVVENRLGDWAQVRAINGWRGWVDARRLIQRG